MPTSEQERLQRRLNDATFAKDAALASSREARRALNEIADLAYSGQPSPLIIDGIQRILNRSLSQSTPEGEG
jgi:hypothetical protein